jgi:predicted nuclease of predicted toxin-antitoxin system
VRFLVDQALSRTVADNLRLAGHDVVHTGDIGLAKATDSQILERAAVEGRVVLSPDTDFGALLAGRGAAMPSVILVRLRSPRRGEGISAMVLANLDAVASDLDEGAVVVLEDGRVRVRRLPLGNR